MTLVPTREVGSDEAGESSIGLMRRPLWIVSGQLGVIIAVVLGFGARTGLKPKMVVLLLLVCLVGLIGFGPPGGARRIIVTAPVVAITAWWMFSYLWTTNVYGWWTDTQLGMPYVVALVVLVGVLPPDAFRRALVAACYVAIAYTVLELITHPANAMVNPDGVPGWRGGFIHKNGMGPFMVFAALTIATFDRPSLRRYLGVLTAIGLVVMSQSSTALGAGVVTLLICLLLRRLAVSERSARASLVVGALCLAVLIGVLSRTVFSTVLGLSGKDSTLTGRTEIWKGVWNAIERQPWQGYGAGGVWSNPAADPGYTIRRGLGFTVYHSHNGLLEILLLLGVVGLGLYVWLMWSTMRSALNNLRGETETAVFTVGYIVLIVVLSITEVAVLGIWLGLLCALNCLMVRIDAKRPRRAVLMAG
jgi:O-antigen ligase